MRRRGLDSSGVLGGRSRVRGDVPWWGWDEARSFGLDFGVARDRTLLGLNGYDEAHAIPRVLSMMYLTLLASSLSSTWIVGG